MAKQVQFRRGTTSEHSTFTGAKGEITVDTTKKVAVVHDGVTTGGFPGARASDVTAANTAISSLQSQVTLLQLDVNSLDPTGAATEQAKLRANISAANVQIASLSSSLTAQATTINTLTNNLAGANTVAVAQGVQISVASGRLDVVEADIIGANTLIVSSVGALTANDVIQASQIIDLRANITAANTVIATLTSNAASQESKIALTNANVTAANATIASVSDDAVNRIDAANVSIGGLRANIIAANSAITALQSNAATQETEITSLRANVIAANSAIDTNLTNVIANLVTRTNEEGALRANITAANAAIVAANTALKNYTDDRFTTLIGGAPALLDTLNELSAALADDADFSTTITGLITSIQSNVTAANAAILVNTNDIAASAIEITNRTDAANARVNSANLNISLLNANVSATNVALATANSALSTLITTTNANVTAANVEISALRANVTAANAAIVTVGTRVDAANARVDSANVEISSLQANIAAANAAISTVDLSGVASIIANVSALQGNILANGYVFATGVTANANVVVGGIISITGNASAGNVTTTALSANAANIASLGVGTLVSTGNIAAPNFLANGNIVMSSLASTLRFVRTSDTAVTLGEVYGRIEFAGEDSSSSASGVRSRIYASAADTNGAVDLYITTAGSNSTSLSTRAFFSSSTTSFPSLDLTVGPTAYSGFGTTGSITFLSQVPASTSTGLPIVGSPNNTTTREAQISILKGSAKQQTVVMTGTVDMTTDTSANIDLGYPFQELGTSFWNSGYMAYANQVDLDIWINGVYIPEWGTAPASNISRFRKRIVATCTVFQSNSKLAVLDQQLMETVYNSDATNWPAGAANAGSAYLVANVSGINDTVYLRLANRTSPSANSQTWFSFSITARTLNSN